MIKSKSRLLIIFIIFGASLLLVFLKFGGTNHFSTLKYYGRRDTRSHLEDGKEVIDTLYHTIPKFKFINQYGDTISNGTFDRKIYVADFIFTNCDSQCPMMTQNMGVVQDAFRSNPDVSILSHTIDPDRDSLPRLKEFSNTYGAIPGKWHFVTGEEQEIYKIAAEGYYAKKPEKSSDPNSMAHEQKFILVDKEGHIRGFYNGMDLKEVDRLVDEIRLLIHHYENGE